MFGRILLLLILIPFLEIFILIRLIDYLGFWLTLALLILIGVLGFVLIRMQGFSLLAKIRQEVNTGVPPAQTLLDGLYIAIGGVLLIIPGLLSDVAALLLLFPATRKRISKTVTPWLINRFFRSGRWYIRRW